MYTRISKTIKSVYVFIRVRSVSIFRDHKWTWFFSPLLFYSFYLQNIKILFSFFYICATIVNYSSFIGNDLSQGLFAPIDKTDSDSFRVLSSRATRGRAACNHEESFCVDYPENRYRFSAAAQKDNGVTLADMVRPDSNVSRGWPARRLFPSPFFSPFCGVALFYSANSVRTHLYFNSHSEEKIYFQTTQISPILLQFYHFFFK